MTREKAINVLEDALSRAVFMDDIDVLKMAISALREQEDPKAVLVEHYIKVPEKPKWISVEERLPEKQADVLMLFEHNMAVGFWHDGDEETTFWCAYTDDGFYTDCDCEPTHWMPLPEATKEEA